MSSPETESECPYYRDDDYACLVGEWSFGCVHQTPAADCDCPIRALAARAVPEGWIPIKLRKPDCGQIDLMYWREPPEYEVWLDGLFVQKQEIVRPTWQEAIAACEEGYAAIVPANVAAIAAVKAAGEGEG